VLFLSLHHHSLAFPNNSEANMSTLDEECDVDNTSIECMDYGRFLDELYVLRDMIGEKKPNKRGSLIDTLKVIRLQEPQSAPVKSRPELTKALEAAKKATAENGVTSVEARLAWETYEDIAASGLDNSIGVNLSEECDVEAGADACKAIEELQRVMPVLLSLSMTADGK